MAEYKVPQDVEAEDKLIGPLTFRRALYAGVAAIGLVLGYFLFDVPPRPFWAFLPLPIVIIFLILALYPSKDQPVEVILAAKVRFAIKPRRRIWDQRGVKQLVTVMAPRHTQQQRTKGYSQAEVSSRLSALAKTLDSRGWAVKNINLNTYAQPVYASGPSDQRLISPAVLPQAAPPPQIDIGAADDIMDHRSNPVAQHFDQMMNRAAEEQRRSAIDRMHKAAHVAPTYGPTTHAQTTQQTPEPHVAPHVALPSQHTNNPAAYATFGATVIKDPQQPVQSQDQPMSQEEALLLERLKSSPKEKGHPSSNMKRIKTPKEVAAEAAAEAAKQPSPELPNPAILNLANNDDLNIATLARQAEAAAGKLGDDEVVITLH